MPLNIPTSDNLPVPLPPEEERLPAKGSTGLVGIIYTIIDWTIYLTGYGGTIIGFASIVGGAFK